MMVASVACWPHNSKENLTSFTSHDFLGYGVDFVVHDEMISFICDMDEADYIRARQLAAAAQAAGSVTSGTSDEDSNAETIGDILQAGGAAAEAALGECYEVELIFECVH